MIGYLKGTLLSRHDPHILINVSGVGYKVYAAADVLTHHVGDEVEIFVHTHVREDALELYGFANEGSLSLFELLISVNGVGPKTAINVFAVGTRDEILKAIRSADTDFFTNVPRLGKKNAQKIIIELKNKLGSTEDIDLAEDGDDVVQALMGFGFSKDEAREAARSVGENGKTTAEKIKLALKYVGK